jgi:hypothetical protein
MTQIFLFAQAALTKPIGLNVFYWLLAFAPGLPFLLLYTAYRKTLLHKCAALQNLMSQKGVFDSYQARFGQAGEKREQTMLALFNLYYGPTIYSLAVGMNLVVITIGVAIAMIRGGVPIALPGDIGTLIQSAPLTLSLGFAGAYLQSLYDTLRRCRASDLSAYSLHFTWVHMVMASILAPLISQAFAPGVAGPVAFGLGLFPIKDTVDYVRNMVRKKLEITMTSDTVKGPSLSLVQGLNKEVIDRLEEEGITSTVELAFYDPIKLFLKTNFQWAWVIDVMDQAFLINYVGDKIEALRPVGIRGAIEMSVAGDPDENSRAAVVIAIVAGRLEVSDEQARNLGGNLYEDGQVDLIWQLFRPYEAQGRANG